MKHNQSWFLLFSKLNFSLENKHLSLKKWLRAKIVIVFGVDPLISEIEPESLVRGVLSQTSQQCGSGGAQCTTTRRFDLHTLIAIVECELVFKYHD